MIDKRDTRWRIQSLPNVSLRLNCFHLQVIVSSNVEHLAFLLPIETESGHFESAWQRSHSVVMQREFSAFPRRPTETSSWLGYSDPYLMEDHHFGAVVAACQDRAHTTIELTFLLLFFPALAHLLFVLCNNVLAFFISSFIYLNRLATSGFLCRVASTYWFYCSLRSAYIPLVAFCRRRRELILTTWFLARLIVMVDQFLSLFIDTIASKDKLATKTE